MRDTADVTGGKPIAVLLQPISGVSAINPLVAFYDIHRGEREVPFFYFVPDTTRDIFIFTVIYFFLFVNTCILYIENAQTQYKQTCSYTQMFVLIMSVHKLNNRINLK
jgi:hypothetical protein